MVVRINLLEAITERKLGFFDMNDKNYDLIVEHFSNIEKAVSLFVRKGALLARKIDIDYELMKVEEELDELHKVKI